MNRKEATEIIFEHFQGTGLKISWHKAQRIAGAYLAGKVKGSDLPPELQGKLDYADPTGNEVVRRNPSKKAA